uniref:Ornithine aminotransferase n=1 Tax=Lygus hesperus TaxID=30085 RepID=A0A0A9XHY6_LYGHE
MWGKRAAQKIRRMTQESIRQVGTKKASKSAGSKSEALMEMEKKFAARIYDPIPVVIAEGKGCIVKDADGARYLDFLGGYASVNTGHCHPKIVAAVQNQVMKLHQVSRAFYNSELPVFAEYITRYFNYDRVIPMNTGVEGGDTAIKMARKWGYLSKGIPENQAIVVFPIGNFWGRSTSAISTSNNPTSFEHYGPYMPGFGLVPYDNVCALEEVLQNKNVCAYMMEPIQGEGGVIVPSDGYLKEVRRLCSKYNVLFIADEVQTGLGRTGALLACDHECVRPDILVLGKGLAGAVTPMSAVLANEEIMCHMTPGSHGSTYGGNPFACALARKTLEVILEECLIENARKMGEKLRAELKCKLPKVMVPAIRGKGLMNAIEIHPDFASAHDLCLRMKECGLLAKSATGQSIRLTPPLVITEEEMEEGIEIITKAVHSFAK